MLHGKNNMLGNYEPLAFFIRHDPMGQEFLFFGDVSPNSPIIAGAGSRSPSSKTKPKNIAIWHAAAPKIPTALSALFTECSWPSGRPDKLLYGHPSPEHLADKSAAPTEQVMAARPAATASKGSSSGSNNDTNNNDNLTTAADKVAMVPKVKKCQKNRSADPPSRQQQQ